MYLFLSEMSAVDEEEVIERLEARIKLFRLLKDLLCIYSVLNYLNQRIIFKLTK